MADLRIDLAAEFRGKKAFKEAAKATTSLDKAVSKLGKQVASVFAASKVIAYGKASVKAFIEDERATAQLATAVKNLGLAFAQPEINNYISKLESTTGILDDQLRPALQSLLTTTGSLTKSQELLGLAIEGARGSGKDLTTVAQDLAQAYVGNTRGLRKYNLGLTQAQLKTASFTEIQQKFQQQFSGANAAYLATYAGKLDVLKVASDRAKEAIGKGLVDALVLAGGKDGDVQDVADAMSNLSNYTADTIRGLGVLAGKLANIDQNIAGGFLGKLLDLGTQTSLIRLLNKLGADASPRPTAGRRFMGGAQANLYSSSTAAEKKYQAQQKALAAAQTKAAKALTAEQKKQAALKKAGSIFDLEQIQLIAALKGQLSDEDRKRVELQFALITGNEVQAKKLTYELAIAQGLSIAIAKELASIPQAANPFASWDAYLDMLIIKARQVASVASGAISAPATTNTVSSYTGTPFGQAGSFVDTMGTPFGQAGGNGSGYIGTPFGQAPVVVQIDGKTIASALQDTSLSGIPSSVNRTLGSFGR
jgi:hypothetical protein